MRGSHGSPRNGGHGSRRARGRSRLPSRAALGVACVLSLFGCAAPRTPPPAARDLVLVTIDTLRWDATGFSGAARCATPHLDALARGGLAWSDAHAHAVVTLASHASILTGLYPYQHGVHDNAGFRLEGTHETLAARLAAQGFATGAFVSAWVLDHRFGLARGFATYDDEVPGRSGRELTVNERPGEETVRRATLWWRGHAGTRRFLWVHLFAPHFPYAPPAALLARHRDRPYFGEVELADAQLGALLDAVRADAPAIVVTADHGESLGEHGEETHGLFAYEATLRVPLVIAGPGVAPADPPSGPARHVDVVPTALALLGVAAPRELPGRDLRAAGQGTQGSYFEALSAYYNRGWAPLTGSIEGGRKAIRLPLPELYDLAADAGETKNLAAERPEELRRRIAALPPPPAPGDARPGADAEQRARLASLGYVASRPPDAAAPQGAANDPKTLAPYERALDAALALHAAGRLDEAIARLEALVAAQPRMSVAWLHLSYFEADAGRPAAAARTLERALAAGAGNESVRRHLALLLARTGAAERAAAVLAPDADSDDPETRLALGRVAARRGRADEARAQFERVLAADPQNADAEADLGVLALDGGALDEARARLDRALAANPNNADAWNARGVVAARQQDPARAGDAWSRAVAIDPALGDAWFNLAALARQAGDAPRAVRALEQYVKSTSGAERARGEALLAQLRRQGPS